MVDMLPVPAADAAPADEQDDFLPQHPGRRRAIIWGSRLVVVAVALVLWQVMSGPVIPRFAVSRPTDVARNLGDLLSSSAGWTDIRTTTIEILIGFGLGILIGGVAGIVLGTFRTVGVILEPLIAALNGIPKVALAPLFLLFFGIGIWCNVWIAASGVAFVMFYNLYYGVRTISDDLTDVVRMMGARQRHLLGFVTLPSLVSPFFAGLKLSGPLAIIGVIVGEFVASFNGIGHRMFEASSNLNSTAVFSAMVVLVVISLLLNGLLNVLDRLVQRWMGAGRATR